MAPKWILNHSITYKVYVYSYGMVVLEMITGKKLQQKMLIWVTRKEIKEFHGLMKLWTPALKGGCDENLP